LELVFVPLGEVTSGQRLRIRELQKECFSQVSREEIQECFIAEGFGWILAYENGLIVSRSSSTVEWYCSKQVSLGGLGGTCVTVAARNRGMEKAIVEKGLEILKDERRSDVACFNADVDHHPDGGLYHQVGFRLMKRKISSRMYMGKQGMILESCSSISVHMKPTIPS
jgi:hypothetical protein